MLSAEGLAQLTRALKDPLKKKIIAKDETIIGGLVLVLSNQDKKIVIEALDILLILAVPLENRLFLREFMGMVDQLSILAKDTNPLDHIRELATQLLSRLESEEPVVVHQPAQPSQPLRARPTNIQQGAPNQRCAKTFNKPFLNASRFKTITLQIDGLDDKNDMEVCREQLLTVKGVVSITFDLSKHRSIVRVKPDITPHKLASAIRQSNTMVARHVVKSDGGDEQIIELNESLLNEDKENTAMPGYLSDEDSPKKIDDKAIRRFGVKEEENGAGWLGAAASFLAKSFYW